MRHYHVTIYYREPTFEARTGPRDHPFQGSFEVRAPGPEQAVRRAKAQFEEWKRRSSVAWIREIERVEVHEMPAGQTEHQGP
jgi:hypothetical protein